jgi:hypothetical protein
MGYFQRKLRRSRCRAEIADAMRRPVPPDLTEWVRATSAPPRGPDFHFIRLATQSIDDQSHEPQGVFAAAYELRRDHTLARRHREALNDLLTWFGENLTAPKTIYALAIFWFRSDAHPCIENIWRLIDVLRANDIAVTMMHTDKPGTIVYEDALQVAAVPFGDVRPIPRLLPTRPPRRIQSR